MIAFQRLALTIPFALALAACSSPPEEAADESTESLAEPGTLQLQLAGTTALSCTGDACILQGQIHSVDARGTKTAAFASYLAGANARTAPADGAVCALTFRGQPIGGGAGCTMPSPSGKYAGDLVYRLPLTRADVATLLQQNANLSVTSRQGKAKFTISFALGATLVGESGSIAYPAQTPLPRDAYRFAFERSASNDLAFRVRRSTDSTGRWVQDIAFASGESHIDTYYQVEDSVGLDLYRRAGYAAVLAPRLFVDEALAAHVWHMIVRLEAGSDYALAFAAPKITAAPFAIGTKQGREAYADDPRDTTGLSGCTAGAAGGWTCNLTVKK
jgi:hypothetical protein